MYTLLTNLTTWNSEFYYDLVKLEGTFLIKSVVWSLIKIKVGFIHNHLSN